MFFNAVKEGDTVIFASDDEQDRILWVQAMYRATGQSYKPILASQAQKMNPKGGNVNTDVSPLCKSLSFSFVALVLVLVGKICCGSLSEVQLSRTHSLEKFAKQFVVIQKLFNSDYYYQPGKSSLGGHYFYYNP